MQLTDAIINNCKLIRTVFSNAQISRTLLANLDLWRQLAWKMPIIMVLHNWNRHNCLIQRKNTRTLFKGLRIERLGISASKLYIPELSNHEVDESLYAIHDLRAHQALQVSPLFISYSHADTAFVNNLEFHLNKIGVRFWRDIHGLKSGRIETQIDRAIRQNPTVLLVLSKHSLLSDWVEHEVRTARQLEKEIARDVLCPVALDESWKDGRWPKRVMAQLMEYNILDFSEWENDSKFVDTFNKLIDGLELFYK